jgi:hypothetical protein
MLTRILVEQCKPGFDDRQLPLDVLHSPVIDFRPFGVSMCQGGDPCMVKREPQVMFRKFRLTLAHSHDVLAAKFLSGTYKMLRPE